MLSGDDAVPPTAPLPRHLSRLMSTLAGSTVLSAEAGTLTLVIIGALTLIPRVLLYLWRCWAASGFTVSSLRTVGKIQRDILGTLSVLQDARGFPRRSGYEWKY